MDPFKIFILVHISCLKQALNTLLHHQPTSNRDQEQTHEKIML